jgi:predicted small metal-binding protein
MPATTLAPVIGEIEMMRFACKDLGLDCNFAVTGETKEEVMQKAMQHGGIAHAAMMQDMTAEQMDQFAKQLEASIKPA